MTAAGLLRDNGLINWSKSVGTTIDEILPWYQSRGIAPSLREIYYRLVALGLSNTTSAYKQLSNHLVDARMRDKIPWNSINDESRNVYNDNLLEYLTPLEHVELAINYLKNCHNLFKVPRWHCQTNYVEVWTEKKSIVGTIMHFLGDREVRIIPVSGFDGWGDAYKHSQRLESVIRNAEKYGIKLQIHILYLGDFDPSGEAIDVHLKQQLSYFGFGPDNVKFRRIAVTAEQIQEYNLPSKPGDKQTLDKLENDSRTKAFIAEHGELYAVELEALTAKVPDQFEKLVQTEVDNLHDDELYQEQLAKAEHKPQYISGLVQKLIGSSLE